MCKFFNSYEEFPSEFALFPQNFTQLGKIVQDRRSHWSRQISSLPKTCPRYVQKTCPRYVRTIPKICPKYSQEMAIGHIQAISWAYQYDMAMTCPKYGQDRPKICQSNKYLGKMSTSFTESGAKFPWGKFFSQRYSYNFN